MHFIFQILDEVMGHFSQVQVVALVQGLHFACVVHQS